MKPYKHFFYMLKTESLNQPEIFTGFEKTGYLLRITQILTMDSTVQKIKMEPLF